MAKMPSSSKLPVVMLLSVLALIIITHAQTISPSQKFFQESPGQPYSGPEYAPVPPRCFKPPFDCAIKFPIRPRESGE
ncbi:hypothetical protein N665_0701s0010 [Sinapis alba]|nr:hypothetical protein N665_0701s0010 [Sinapis alba]